MMVNRASGAGADLRNDVKSNRHADVFIIGKGPAGISASLYTARAGMSTIVSGKDFGSLARADKIENYFGFAEPVNGDDLCRDGIEGARRLGVNVIDEEVFEIEKDEEDGTFTVNTRSGGYTASAVILAAGVSRKAPPLKGIKEFEGRGVSYCAVCDAFFYRGARVVVIGNGDYAVSEAAHLMNVCSEVTILTNGRELEADLGDKIFFSGSSIMQDSSYGFYAESVNDFDDDCFGATDGGAKFRVITGEIEKVSGGETVESIMFKDGSVMQTDGVFVAEGTASALDLARKLGVVDLEGKIMIDKDMSTPLAGFFAAGDCTGGLLQVAKAVGDGAVAGMAAAKFVRGQKNRSNS